MPTQEQPDTLRSYQKCYIRSAVRDDVDPIAETMRPLDAFECHCGGHDPYEALKLALENDTCTFTIVDKFDHTPLAMFGCGDSDGFPYIWALASDLLVPRAGRDFVRHSPEWIDGMLKAIGGKASNYVYSENFDAIRWLKRCGAKFKTKTVSINNQPFFKFTITQNV